jgi:hypothetical protein
MLRMIVAAYSKLGVHLDGPVALEPSALRLPAGDLGHAAPRVLVEGDVEAFDEIGAVALDEPGDVFGEVLARLGHEVAEPAQHLVADAVVFGDVAGPGQRLQAGVEVLSVALEPEVEGHVVDPGGQIVDLAVGDAQVQESSKAVPCTLWQRPTVRIRLARLMARQLMAMGLV